MGESTEGMFESTAKLRQYLLDAFNVDILEENGKNFKNLKDIVVELGKAYERTDNEFLKQEAAEKLAGKTQMNVLLSAISNYKQIEAAYETAVGSEGSAMREQANYAKSLQYEIDRIKASGQEIASNIMQSETLKDILVIVRDIAEAFAEITKDSNVMIKALGALMGTVVSIRGTGIFNTKGGQFGLSNFGFGQLISSLFTQGFDPNSVESVRKQINEAISKGTYKSSLLDGLITNSNTKKEVDAAITNLQKVGKTGELSSAQITKAFTKSTGAVSMFSKVVSNLGGAFLNIGIALAISMIITEIVKLYDAMTKVEDKMHSMADTLGKEFEESSKEIDQYKKQINDLRASLADNHTSQEQAVEIRKQLLGIEDDLVKKYGKEAGAIDSITAAIAGEADALDNLKDNEYKQKINEFNNPTDLSWYDQAAQQVWRSSNHASTNFGALINEMEKKSISFTTTNMSREMEDYLLKLQGVNVKQISHIGPKRSEINVTGENLRDILETLLQIQDATNTLQDTSGSFATDLSNQISQVNKVVSEGATLYDESVLQHYILGTDYEDVLREANNAYKQYTEEFAKDNVEAANEARSNLQSLISSLVTDIDDTIANEALSDKEVARREAVKDFFLNLFPQIKADIEKQQFEIDYQVEIHGNIVGVKNSHQKDVYDALLSFDNKDQITNLNASELSSEQLKAYNILDQEAKTYGMSLDELIDKLTTVFGLKLSERDIGRASKVAGGLSRAKGKHANWSQQAEYNEAMQYVSDEDFDTAKTFVDQNFLHVERYFNEIKEEQGDAISNTEAWIQATHKEAEAVRTVGNDYTAAANVIKTQIKDAEKEYYEALDRIRTHTPKKRGNVDIYQRPVVQNADGTYSTTSTQTEYTWVGDEENGHYVVVNITPILPDGTELSPEALDDYIYKIANSANPMEADKVENGGLGIVYSAATVTDDMALNQTVAQFENAAEIIHEEQDQLYSDVAEKGAQLVDLNAEYGEAIAKQSQSNISQIVGHVYDDLKPELDALGSAYEKIFADGKNADLSVVDVDMLQSLRKDLENTEDAAKQAFDPEIVEEFFDVISNKKSTTKEVQTAFNKMATSAFDKANIAPDINDDTFNAVTQMLSKLGVANSEIVAFNSLIQNANVQAQAFGESGLKLDDMLTGFNENGQLVLGTMDAMTGKFIQLSQEQNKEIESFIKGKVGAKNYSQALALLKIAKISVNENWINESTSIQQVLDLADAAGIATEAVAALANAQGRVATAEAGLNDAIKSGDTGAMSRWGSELKAAQDQAKHAADDIKEEVDEGIAKFKGLGDAAKGAGGSAKDAAEEAEDALSKLSKQLDDLQSAYEKLCEIQETFNSTGKITVDQAQDLMNMDFRQVYAFVDETGTINATEEAYEDLASAKLYEMKVSLLMKAIDLISTFAEEGVAVEYLKGQYVSLAKAKALAAMGYEGADAVTALTGEMQAAAGAYAPGTASADAAGIVMTAVLAQLKMLDNIDFSSGSGASGAGDKEGGGAGADKASKEDASIEYFDFVERYLNKISKKVDKWLKSVDEMFTFWNKNWAIDRTMLQLEKQIKAQQQAAEVYLQQAEKAAWDVLPEGYEGATIFDIGPENSSMTYAELAKTGMMDVISFGGEDPGEAYTPMIKKQLEAYIEWLDKAEAEREKITELYSKEKELIKQKLSNITEYFDKIQQKFDSYINALDARIAVREASGKKGLLTDVLKQFRAQYDALGLANEKLLAYITGTTKESQRSSEEVMADMAYEKSSMRDSVAYQVSKETKELYEYKDNIYKRTVNDIKELRQAVRETDEKQAKKSLRERIAVLRDLAKQYNIGNMRRRWAKDLTKWTDTYASLFGASDDKQDIETALDELQRKTIKNKKDNNNIARYTKELETNADLEQGFDSEKYKSDVARRDQLLSRQKNFEELQQKLEEKEAARQAAFEAGDKETADALDQQIKEINAAMQQRENKRLTVFEQDTLKILIQNIDRQEQMAAEQTEGTVRQYSQYYLDTVAEIQSLEQRILNSDRLTDQLNEYKAALAQAQADKNKEDVKKYRQLIKETNKELKQKENKKLTKAEELRLHYLRESIDTMDEIEQEAMVDNNVADTAKYKELVTKITNLQNKKKRNNVQEKNLSMYLNELEAINSGVLQEDLTAYMRNYEQWWKLNEKLKTNGSLNVAQNNRLAKLTKIKEGYEKKYLEAQEARQAELEKAQIHEGDKLAEIEYNKNERLKEIDELYEKRVAESDAAAFENSAQYKQITGRIAQLQQLRDSGSKKFNKKAQKELDKLLEKQQALLNGATVDNFDAFNKAWEYVYRNREKYEAGKLKGAAATTYDKYVNMLNQWTNKKQDDIKAILEEWKDARDEITTEYETQENEYKAEVAEREEKTWEYAKAAAMSAIENMQAMIDGLDSMINAYKEIASLLENTTLENLAQYEGLAELLGLDSTKSLEDALKEKLTGAITKSQEKVKTLIEKGQMVTALRDALVEDGSEGMKQFIEQYRDQVSEENKELFEQLVEKGQKVLDKNSNMDELVTMLRNGETEGVDEKIQAILDAYTGEDKAGLENILKSAQNIIDSGGTLDKTIDLLFQWLDSTDYDETDTWIGELDDDLASISSEAVDTLEDIQKLKDEFRENIYFKAINNAIDSLEKFQSKYSSMASLIHDDWTTDKNGAINAMGLAKINVLGQELVQAQDLVDEYAKKVRAIDAAEGDWKRAGYGSKEDYIKARNEAYAQYYSGLENVYSIEQQIYDIGKQARQKEIDQLKEIINLRIDALRKKKEYYDYDRQIKNQTKNVELLQAQVEALNGVNTAEAKAQRQNLLAQLEEAKDTLEDTQLQHEFKLSEDALNGLINDLDKTLDDANETVKQTFDEFVKVLRENLDAAREADVQGVYSTLHDVLMNVGYRNTESEKAIDVALDEGNDTARKQLEEEQAINSVVSEYEPITESQFMSGIQHLEATLNSDYKHFFESGCDRLIDISGFLSSLDKGLTEINHSLQKSEQPVQIDLTVNATIGNTGSALDFDMNHGGPALPQKYVKQLSDEIKDSLYTELKQVGLVRKY